MLKARLFFEFNFRRLQHMIWHFFRYCLTFFFPTFYKRVQVRNSGALSTDKPMVIVMNHPNAFTDPIMFSYITYPVRTYYMARGDAFKPGIANWFLRQMRIIPVFRKQDAGIAGLKKNDETFQLVNELLKKRQKVIVFGEGLCVQERRLRPLKKGVARMVFGAYMHENIKDLLVLPVCVNYSQPDKFRSDVFYNIGEPIAVSQYHDQAVQNLPRAQNVFLRDVEMKMRELLTHIDDANNDKLVLRAEEICKHEVMRSMKLNPRSLYEDFIALKHITEKINHADPAKLAEFRSAVDNYYHVLASAGLKAADIGTRKRTPLSMALRGILLLCALPVYLIGYVTHIVQLRLTDWLATSLLKEKEFYSSVAITGGPLIFITFYLLFAMVINIFSEGPFIPLLFLTAIIGSGVCAMFIHPHLTAFWRDIKALRSAETLANIRKQQVILLNTINKF
jgi:glycerol-3-phosphate O-acyltransferase / dihydroxyacetone phosphate acyltransferase